MSEVSDIVVLLHATRQQKAALEKTEKELLSKLKPLVDSRFDDPATGNRLVCGSLWLDRTPGVTRSINAEKLLSHGVAPDVIADCTTTTPYFRYVVTDPAAKSQHSAGAIRPK